MTPDELRNRITTTLYAHGAQPSRCTTLADAVMVDVREAIAAERKRLVQRVIAGDLSELSSVDRRRVVRWLEQQP